MLGLILAVATPTVITAGGCSAFGQVEDSPTGKFFTAQEAFIAGVRTARAAKAAGKIDQNVWDDFVLPAINRGDEILDDLQAAAIAGDSLRVDMLREALVAVNRVLAERGS